jgi:hypothetical protein
VSLVLACYFQILSNMLRVKNLQAEKQEELLQHVTLHTYVTPKHIHAARSKTNSNCHGWPALFMHSQGSNFSLWLLWRKHSQSAQTGRACCTGLWLPFQVPRLQIDWCSSLIVTECDQQLFFLHVVRQFWMNARTQRLRIWSTCMTKLATYFQISHKVDALHVRLESLLNL